MFDQMSAQSLPCYGHGVVRAPHLQGLAERGVVFENAYCNSPLCSPSRFAMMTGQLPSRIGAYDNAAELRGEHADLCAPSAGARLSHLPLRQDGFCRG